MRELRMSGSVRGVPSNRHPYHDPQKRDPKSAKTLRQKRCPNCGGQLKIIAAILESAVIERSLTHLGLQASAPPACRW